MYLALYKYYLIFQLYNNPEKVEVIIPDFQRMKIN